MEAKLGRHVGSRAGLIRQRMACGLQQIEEECQSVAHRFGFLYFHFGVRAMLSPAIPVQVFVDGGPAGQHAVYESRQWLSENSVLARATHALIPFDWREALSSSDDTGKATLQRWMKLGMQHGIAVPLHASTAHGIMLFSGDTPLPKADHLRTELFREVHWTLVQLFERTLRAMTQCWEVSPRDRLTVRQRKALVGVSEGRSLSAVGRKLGVHSSTARYLVMRATEKLAAKTREEAIVRLAAAGEFNNRLFPESIRDSHFLVASRRASATNP